MIDIAFYSEWDDIRPWKTLLRKKGFNLLSWPKEIENSEKIEIALVWDPPKNMLNKFPNLKLVHSLGAGVDHIKLKDLNEKLKITRLVDPDLSAQMSEYIVMSVLMCQRNIFQYSHQQKIKLWKQLKNIPKSEFQVSLLGYGKIGKDVNKKLNLLGFTTKIWTRTKKITNNKNFYHGKHQLIKCLKDSSCVVSVLPLTKETRNIINLSILKTLSRNSYFINVGRGKTVKEEDLIYALSKKIINGAVLDVFDKEPLKERNPLWNMQNVIITPHIAANTRVTEHAVNSFVDNIKALYRGKPLKYLVSKHKGY